MKNNDVKPINSYFNAKTLKVKILKDNKNKSGVYKWINNINGRSYVGSSKSLHKRFGKYYNITFLIKEVIRGSSKIYNALLKNSYSNFRLEILEYCEPNKLLKREQYYIDLLQPEYNICKKAGSKLGYKHSLITKNLISNTLKNRLINIKPIKVVNIETKIITYFATNLEAANFLGTSLRTLGRYKNGRKLLYNKYCILNNIYLHGSYK